MKQLLLIGSGSAVTTCRWQRDEHGAGALHVIQYFGLKDVEYTTDSGANLTLNCSVSDVRLPIVSVFCTVAAGCVVHVVKGHTLRGTPALPAQ